MGSVAAVRTLVVVESVESPVEPAQAKEPAPTELHPLVLAQDRALEPLREAIGPCVTRLGPGVADPKLPELSSAWARRNTGRQDVEARGTLSEGATRVLLLSRAQLRRFASARPPGPTYIRPQNTRLGDLPTPPTKVAAGSFPFGSPHTMRDGGDPAHRQDVARSAHRLSP